MSSLSITVVPYYEMTYSYLCYVIMLQSDSTYDIRTYGVNYSDRKQTWKYRNIPSMITTVWRM